MTDELIKQKELKLLPVLTNFNEIVRSKGRLFVLEIIEYINRVNNTTDIEQLKTLNLVLGTPTAYTPSVIASLNSYITTVGGIFTYLDRKISKVYIRTLNTDILGLDDLELAIYNDIFNLKNNVTLKYSVLKPYIEKVIDRTEVL